VLIGTLWLSWPGENEFVKIFPQLISVAAEHRGHAVLFAAPSQLKEGIDVWGPPPATYSLMRKIKQQFDPDSLLNAGRFAAGI
jgi:glycolate oxidase FAD binding subunit